MDLIDLFNKLGTLNDVAFKNTLIRKITMDYYYILDIRKKPQEKLETPTSPRYEAVFMKREGIAEEIPNRIRLYAQPVKQSIGASLTTSYLSTKDKIEQAIEQVIHLFPESPLSHLLYEEIEFLEDDEFFEEHTNLKLRGYTSIALDGRLLVDILKDYDKVLVGALYKEYQYLGDSCCYVCGQVKGDYFGSLREPAWKLITTTRKTEISRHQGEVFVRCAACEESIMKGVHLLSHFTRVTRGKTRNLERVIIPWTNDKRLWQQLIKIRKETDSDLRYYQTIERLYERFVRRGLTQFIEIGVMRSNTSYGILSVDMLSLKDLQGLKEKDSYERFLKNNLWLREEKSLSYYPDEVAQYDDDYKWRLLDLIKRYWIGKESKEIWHHINGVVHLGYKDKVFYELWEDYLLYGSEGLANRVHSTRGYIAGQLVKNVGKLERMVLKDIDKENLLANRFKTNTSGDEYIISECLKVYRRRSNEFRIVDEYLCDVVDKLLLNEPVDFSDGINYFNLGRYELTKKQN